MLKVGKMHFGALTLLLTTSTMGQVLPQNIHKRDAIQSRDNDNTNYSEDAELSRQVMVFSLIFMMIVYGILSLIFVLIRFFMQRLFARHVRISLVDVEDVERGGRHSRARASHRRSRNTDLTSRWPSILDDEDEVRPKLERLQPEEQFYYKQGEEYIKSNPPLLIPSNLAESDSFADPIINEETQHFIEEEGANAWEFQPDPNLPNDTIMVQNKTEITFLNFNYDASVSTNLPIPCVNRVYYCEFKIYELNIGDEETATDLGDNEIISFGLSTSPYPYFRLPGRHHHSIAYDSTGARRFNDSFELEPDLATVFPRCERGDVVGVGYRTNSGTVFFTRNGKKLNEKSVGGHLKGWKFKYLYPIVGANVPCKIHANFGTYGFVFIEANVKKWGYSKAFGLKLPPPSYEEYCQDTLLESGGEEDDSDNDSILSAMEMGITDSDGHLLPPPPGFEYSTSPNNDAFQEQITLDSYPAEPPNYSTHERMSGEHRISTSFRDFDEFSENMGLLENEEHDNGTSDSEAAMGNEEQSGHRNGRAD